MEPDADVTDLGADSYFMLPGVSPQMLEATLGFLREGHNSYGVSMRRHIVQHMESLREDSYLRWITDMSLHYRYVSSHVHFDWRSTTDDLVKMINNLGILRRRNPGITPVQERTVMIVSLSLLKGQGFRDITHFYESSAMLKDRSFVRSLLALGEESHSKIPERVDLVMNRSTRSVRLPEVLSALNMDSAPSLSNGAL